MTEPTDNELDIVLSKHWPAFATMGTLPLIWTRAAFREAIAKWGTPPRISESDTDYWVRNRALILRAIEERGFRLVSAGGLFWLSGSAHPSPPDGMVMVPKEPTEAMKAAAVKYANGSAVYKNLAADVLRIEEGIYGEVYEAMIAAAPQPTQAQAVAVPLTDGQVESLLCKYGYDPDDEHMAAMLKEANGIKGGQHDPD